MTVSQEGESSFNNPHTEHIPRANRYLNPIERGLIGDTIPGASYRDMFAAGVNIENGRRVRAVSEGEDPEVAARMRAIIRYIPATGVFLNGYDMEVERGLLPALVLPISDEIGDAETTWPVLFLRTGRKDLINSPKNARDLELLPSLAKAFEVKTRKGRTFLVYKTK